jgi:glycosyltransferase involved in cell wall biosynthesis
VKIGIVFHKNPVAAPSSIDLIRLKAISKGLINRGMETEILAPVEKDSSIDGIVPVRRLSFLKYGSYDLVKTCYHFSIDLIHGHEGPVVSRIVRVVDDRLPERDEAMREHLLRCQTKIRERASCVIVNNAENEKRWYMLYGPVPPVMCVPTGCPSVIPLPEKNPFDPDEKVVLFLGSLAAPRMIPIINDIARRLDGIAKVHFIGSDKSYLYGKNREDALSHLIIQHGVLPEDRIWNYIFYANIGLAIATGPYPFDNDMSKIFSYLRGGLPVLSEEPIINNMLISETGFGLTFQYDNMEDLTEKVMLLLRNPPLEKRRTVMDFMAYEHSWEHRVDAYVKLFHALTE